MHTIGLPRSVPCLRVRAGAAVQDRVTIHHVADQGRFWTRFGYKFAGAVFHPAWSEFFGRAEFPRRGNLYADRSHA